MPQCLGIHGREPLPLWEQVRAFAHGGADPAASFARASSVLGDFFTQTESLAHVRFQLLVGERHLSDCTNASTFKPKTDYEGHDIVKGGVKATDAADCCTQCSKSQSCKYGPCVIPPPPSRVVMRVPPNIGLLQGVVVWAG